MKAASTTLTRICLLGGEWKGRRVGSFLQRYSGTDDYAEDFDEFDSLIEDALNFMPYIHYDRDTNTVVKVTNEPRLYAVDRKGSMFQIEGFDVMKMRMPDDETLYKWYEVFMGRRARVEVGARTSRLGNHV